MRKWQQISLRVKTLGLQANVITLRFFENSKNVTFYIFCFASYVFSNYVVAVSKWRLECKDPCATSSSMINCCNMCVHPQTKVQFPPWSGIFYRDCLANSVFVFIYLLYLPIQLAPTHLMEHLVIGLHNSRFEFIKATSPAHPTTRTVFYGSHIFTTAVLSA